MVKNYVLDTNLLLDNPNVIYGFQDNNVYITGVTLQELDNHKNDRGEVGYNTREVGRILDELRKHYGRLKTGVPLKSGGTLHLLSPHIENSLLPAWMDSEKPDNRIIEACMWLKEKERTVRTILLSNDTYLRINADNCGIETESVWNDRVLDSNYTGHRFVNIQDQSIIDALHDKGTIDGSRILCELSDDEPILTVNEFLTLRYGKQSVLSIYDGENLNLIPSQMRHIFGDVKPRNVLQHYALWALTNPEIDLVILKGPAGTAKTFLSLAAGLTQSYMGQPSDEDLYQQIMISRPNVEGSDRGFGAIPGGLERKMAPLLASYSDNLENILSYADKSKDRNDIQDEVEDLFLSGAIEMCPLNYIRGRSLRNKYLICDEAQNANAQLIKAVVTRAGIGTKVIVAGDPDQCDAPHLDKYTNGLTYISEAMKGAPNTVILRFDESQCERSNLAKVAVERMK